MSHEQKPQAPLMYALATDYAKGWLGEFAQGPCAGVRPEWLAGDGLIFQIRAGQPPALAVEAVLPLAGRMGEAMYRQLQALDESMALAAARGEDAEADFEVRWRAVEKLMEGSPWTFHPDHGLIRKSDADAISEVESMSP